MLLLIYFNFNLNEIIISTTLLLQQAAIDSSLATQETRDTNEDVFADELSSKTSERVIEDSNDAASRTNMES